MSDLHKKAEDLFPLTAYTPARVTAANREKWLQAIRFLGERHLLHPANAPRARQ